MARPGCGDLVWRKYLKSPYRGIPPVASENRCLLRSQVRYTQLGSDSKTGWPRWPASKGVSYRVGRSAGHDPFFSFKREFAQKVAKNTKKGSKDRQLYLSSALVLKARSAAMYTGSVLYFSRLVDHKQS